MNDNSDCATFEAETGVNRPKAGFVIIGRNEGARLEKCISSVLAEANCAVYVDSGSSDASVALAESYGLPIVRLDPARPFTAARARNAGLNWMLNARPELGYVHFIDGDCELIPSWLDTAFGAMAAEPDLAAVCGRRRERSPNASVYNKLCEDEWNTPVGIADTCGGDALFRVEPLRQVNGFSEELIAGEEPDLCHRIRLNGWRIRRIAGDMTVHDAAMLRFSQWWQRNRRSGYATAEAFVLRGAQESKLARQVASNVFWSIPLSWPLLPLLWLKICFTRGPVQASYFVLGKLPHMQGQVDFWRSRKSLIEYK